MAPSPGGTASCMKRPRSRTARSAAASPSAPPATNAEYSPSECPAAQTGAAARAAKTAWAAIEAARIAGCVLAVSFKASSGPSKHKRESFSPKASSAASNTARASANCEKSSLPIPTDWHPCPGKTKPIFIRALPTHQRAAPGDPGADRHHRDEIARPQPARPVCFVERGGHRGGRGVAVLGDVEPAFLERNPQSAHHRLDDSKIRLMGDDVLDLLRFDVVRPHRLGHRFGQRAHR